MSPDFLKLCFDFYGQQQKEPLCKKINLIFFPFRYSSTLAIFFFYQGTLTECRKSQKLQILSFHCLKRYVQVTGESQNYSESSSLLFIYFFK